MGPPKVVGDCNTILLAPDPKVTLPEAVKFVLTVKDPAIVIADPLG